MKPMSARFSGTAVRRRTALTLSAVMVGTLLQAVAAPTASAEGIKPPALPKSEKPVPGRDGLKVKPRTLTDGPRTPARAPRGAWPEAGTATASIPDSAAKGAKARVRVGDLPIGIARAKEAGGRTGKAHQAPPDRVEARVLGRDQAERIGVDGLLIRLAPKTAPGEQANAASEIAVTVDYGQFAEAFGGHYASRLKLIELPACSLTTPDKDACRAGEPIASKNNTAEQTLSAEAVKLNSGRPTVLAAVASTEGDKGDYKASALAPSATWSTNLNTGDFTWSYDMPVPEVPGGLKPNVGLSYSSGAIDGRTGNTNNQASWVGDGFDLWPGYIERRYKSCADDGEKKADGNKPGDQCWAYDNAFISFNGKGGELVPVGDNEWKFKQDDGSKIAKLTSSNRENGDDNNEYWRLTASNGTRYYFGYHKMPGWTSGKETTDSVWTVPVYGNDSGEPCHASAFADSWCQQAWRWNLDYVVDPHSNAVSYHYAKETNSYGRNLTAADDTPYTRGGYLKRIDYGLKSSAMFAKPQAKVDFGNAERCLPQEGVTCGSSTIDDKSFYWYDTPWDLNCKAGTECGSGNLSPSFWTRKRLTDITTQVLKTDGTYGKVDSWKLGHRWGMADVDYQLLLDSVQHTGHTATTELALPKTTFAYTQLANRLDKTGDGFAPFIKERLSTVADEYGGQIDVTYSAEACSASGLPTPHTNTTRCFPQYIGGDSDSDPVRQWFNKYVVTSATATDRTGGSPDQVSRYTYLGGAAWHFDDDGLTKEKHKTWSQWRGYGHVRVQTGGQGGASAMKSQQDHYFLRGMHGDRAAPDGGTRTVTAVLGDGEGDAITDHESAAGHEYKTVTFDKPDGKILGKSVMRPWHHQTAKKVRDWGTVTANFTGVSHTKNWTSLDGGAGAKWRTTSTGVTFDTVAGRVTRIDDRGDDAVTTDNRCTTTTYAADDGKNIMGLPSRAETLAKACGQPVDRSKDVISDVRTAYDGGEYGAAPSKGDVTATATLKSHDGATATYLESGTTYDSYGRPLTATDLTATVTATETGTPVRVTRNDGRTVSTTYTPATGRPTQSTITSPPADPADQSTAQTTTTDLDPLRGLPLKKKDTNAKVTEYAYDALGRTLKVWLADRRNTALPSHEFAYTVTEGKPVVIAAKRLDNNGDHLTSYTVYDGFLRERQTQVPGPDGGRLLADVFYDERGLASKTFAPYYAEGKPTTSIFRPEEAEAVETQTRTTFDGLGRESEIRQIAGNGDGGKVLNTTTSIYGGDRVTVIPPTGGTATTTVSDARGNTTELRQHHQRAVDAAYDTTRYEHTPSGELAKVTDPAGNTWSYEYDQLGRQTVADDPDAGITRTTYDERGQVETTTDSRDVTLAHIHDNLGRKIELREDSVTGKLRAKWVYDTIVGAKGHLAESIRYVNGEAYTTKVSTYDQLYRPIRTAVVIPAAEGALAGTYQTGTSYKPSGLVAAVSYSAAGSLPGGSFNFGYEEQTLRPIAVFGQGMSTDIDYGVTGKPLEYQFGLSDSDAKTYQANTYEWGTQRLATSQVGRQDQNGVDRHVTYQYDEAGNVLSMADVSRNGTDTQCFTYDHLTRLTDAWTQNTTTCAGTPAGGGTGGPAPYWHTYTYDKAGNRLTETLHDTAGDSSKDVKRTYTYPEPGTPQAHTLTSFTSEGPGGTSKSSYRYDKTGNTTLRTIGGTGQKLTWDAEGHLAKVTEPVEGKADKVTEYLYDTEGNRLIGRTDTETTLYLGHTEVTLAKGASKAKATRYIDLGGGHQAIRTDDGAFAFTIADHHGTGQLSVDAATLKLSQRRSLPFGGLRGAPPAAWPGTKGFVGGTDDTRATGLIHLGAREYDPDTGRFISVDPILDLADPQQMHGYVYGNNNPATLSDPTGLRPDGPAGGNSMNDERLAQKNGTQGSHVYKGGGKWEWTTTPHQTTLTANDVKAFNNPVNQALTIIRHIAFKGIKAEEHHRQWYSTFKAHYNQMNGSRLNTDDELAKNAYAAALNACSVERTCRDTDVFNQFWDLYFDDALKDVGLYENAGPGFAQSVVGKGFAQKHGTKTGDCKCFLAGTDVLMSDGTTEDIEDIEVGDKVLATDPKTGATSEREVTATIVTDDDKHFTDLTITTPDGPEDLVATHEHPFWVVSERKWVEAGDLEPGMSLRTDDGRTVLVAAARQYQDHQRTYNLTIEGVHTYYVLAGQTPVLVHNSNCPNGKLSDPLPRGMNNKIASAYDDVKAGRIPSHDTYGGREHPWWAGSKEYRVPGRPETDRILEKELPNGVKVYGWTSTHYTKIQRFSAPHFPDSGWN
ncbi:polymorphic toxin-type HINT domain-containing protein [Streptomyces sp. MAR25Y5]|uniref:polymorphic toxin-type HINT domain-containing protein n=1 Tax=Streptomyces sp. MAR25Y5 TaxID=2962028 RepID=UPI0020B736A1|nr:polymorphic toxin-type HINT domain-containing protein [Streptomyces sp. MAR25Y5]MCP3765362.1 polymorphic toxin-type HINT domain-containing protein [Streptomyces sp. MAR25Y5]